MTSDFDFKLDARADRIFVPAGVNVGRVIDRAAKAGVMENAAVDDMKT